MSVVFNKYIIMLLWCGIIGVLLDRVKLIEHKVVSDNNVKKYGFFTAFILFLPFVFWAATRGSIADTAAYINRYLSMPCSFAEIPEYMSTFSKDMGFYWFTAVLRVFFGERFEIYLFIIALIQSYFLIQVYRRYSIDFSMSVFLFVASTDYFAWMFNGMRQFIAATMIFGGIGFILKKKYVFAIILILFASLFHQSALIVLPFIFICQGKAWNKKTLIFIGICLIITIYINQFTNLLSIALEDTQYTNVVSDWTYYNDDGTNLLRVIVYSIPALLSLLGHKVVKWKNDPVINLSINMSIVSAGLYIISMFTSGIYIGRLPIYFSLYSYILLPWEIENFFTRESRKIVYFLLVFLYIVFYLYGMKGYL